MNLVEQKRAEPTTLSNHLEDILNEDNIIEEDDEEIFTTYTT